MVKIKNEAIRKKIGIKKNTVQETEEQQLRWYGHVKRTEDGKIVKQIAEWKPQRKRKRGRPINTWKDVIRESREKRAKGRRMYGSRFLEKKNLVFGSRKTVYSRKNS
jgi:hypothetical protein